MDKLLNNMTVREYFAAMAMQGLLAADVEVECSIKDAVVAAIKHADALIKELEKPNGKS